LSYSWIVWPSKQARDEGMKKGWQTLVFSPRQPSPSRKRLIFGGFEVLLEA